MPGWFTRHRLMQAATSSSISTQCSSTHQKTSPGGYAAAPPKHAELRAAALLVWPGNSPAARAKRAAAAYLLRCPSLAAASSPVAHAVALELGASTQQRGLGPFRQLLQQDDCFSVQNPLESEAWIELLPNR
jgi:hypothetical protein